MLNNSIRNVAALLVKEIGLSQADATKMANLYDSYLADEEVSDSSRQSTLISIYRTLPRSMDLKIKAQLAKKIIKLLETP